MMDISKKTGFTLIETLIGIALFVMISVAVYLSYSNILDIIVAAQLNSAGLTVLNNEVETIRNMPYEDVGTIGGLPAGLLLADKTVVFAGLPFLVNTTIRSIDDEFDGTLGGTPDDISPADYKLVEIEISCPECQRFIPAKVTTTVSPLNLENISKNGALLIKVFDAFGQPVANATVQVVNDQVSPTINLTDTTSVDGELELVDVATSSLAYQITVSKFGYSTDKTYPIGAPSNPNPIKPHATVSKQQITNISFAIDKTSAINFKAQDYMCVGVPNVDFSISGSKLIGTNPDIFKYSQIFTTDSGGLKIISGLEWDSYTFQNTDTAFNKSGSSLANPVIVDPDTTTGIIWNVETKDPDALLVAVKDQNGQLLNDATVTLTKTGYSASAVTGRREVAFTDWGGGYSAKSLNLSVGQTLTLADTGSGYASQSDEWLESNTVDFGTTGVQFYDLKFNPQTQPAQTSMKLQIATNTNNSTWNYVGPDGTPASYYTTSDVAIWSGHNGDRYLRYKVWLRTDDDNVTPSLEDVTFEFNSSCIVAGHVLFNGLSGGDYTVLVQKSGFTDVSLPVGVLTSFQETEIIMTP